MANTNRTPKIISTNNPCKIKPSALLEQPSTRRAPRRPNTPSYYPPPLRKAATSSCSETSCSNSPVTHTSNNNYPYPRYNYQPQNTNRNQTQKPAVQNQTQKPVQKQNQNNQKTSYNRLSQSISHPTTPSIYAPVTTADHAKLQKQTSQTNPHIPHAPYENSSHQAPQITRSPSAPNNHASLSPHIRTPHLNPSSNYLLDDQLDSARVNRKILDLEISNASLLAINGALERTKVNQQNEIRTIKKRLQEHQEQGTSHHHNGNGEEGRSARKQRRKKEKGSNEGTELRSEEEETESEEEMSMDRLIEEDREFGHVIQSIEALISSGTRAIHFQPVLNNPSHSSSLSSTTTSTLHENLNVPTGRSKVLDPVQAQRFLSNHVLDNSDLDSSSLGSA